MHEIDEKLNEYHRKSKVIKRFNPNDSRTEFGCPPRLCINTYVGCSHQCTYCYNHWMKGFDKPHEKKDFEKSIRQDIEKIFRYGLDNLIISISNSTDPLQEDLEGRFRHILFALKALKENNLKVLVTTKNPSMLLKEDYLGALNPIKTVLLVTIPFANNNPLEARTPSIDNRITSVQKIVAAGFKTSVRIDPLIPASIGGQSLGELHDLIKVLKQAGITHVISKVLRLVGAIQKRHKDFYKRARDYYLRQGAIFYKNFYQLPEEKRRELLSNVNILCRNEGITLSTCYERLPGVERCDLANDRFS